MNLPLPLIGESPRGKIMASASCLARLAWAMLLLSMGASTGAEQAHDASTVATYSIVAYDPRTKEWGVAVQSKFFGVGSIVPFAKAGVGAIATQARANVRYGPQGLELLASGKGARDTVDALTKDDAERDFRQVAVVDSSGRAAAYTGARCGDWAGHIVGTNFTVQGNILAGEQVVKGMAEAFERARQEPNSELADWLLAALVAAEEAGGDKRGRQSSAMLVVREGGGFARANDRYIDLRVEDHPQPNEELGRLLAIHKEFFSSAHKRKAHYKARGSKSPRALALAR